MKQLSKSEYMLYMRHPAWLWLKKHDKSKLPPIDDDTQAIFDAGFLFESYAEQLFPDALKLEYDRTDYQEYVKLTQRTKDAIDSGAKTVFQGRFEADRITCICDVLVKTDDDSFDLYEIKSSTKVKPEHKLDLAFQIKVMEGSGYKVGKVFVVHVNNQFVRSGKVDAKELATISEVTNKVKDLQEETTQNIAEALAVVDSQKSPDISPADAKLGAFADWLEIYKTLANVDKYSIYNLCSPGANKIEALENMGIKNIADIPDDFRLSEKQRCQVDATKSDEVFINKPRINTFLDSLEYPLYFLDYETLSSVVPHFDGLSPYKQLPFQYSLHVLEKPGGEIKHHEYLHSENSNPAGPLSDALESQIGKKGTVLVWYKGFETNCNKLLGQISPKHAQFYNELDERIIDLMIPFSTCSYVHKDFSGSASIKKVLPVLVPKLSYNDLDIQAGSAAQRLWMESVLDEKKPNEKDKILKDLKEYCELDTFAMVEIYRHLVEITKEDNGANN